VTSGDKRKLRCTHQGYPSPHTHNSSTCEYHAQLVLDRKRDREKAAYDAAFFSALSSNKSGNVSATSYYSCLSDTDSTDSACLSATPAFTDTSIPPPSSSFWSCFAPATKIDYNKKKSAVIDSGASVDITSERHRIGQLTDSPEMVQGISGTTHAWPTRVQWHTKTDCGVLHLLQTEAGFEVFKQLYLPNAPDQILSLSQLVEAGYVPHFRPSALKSWLTTPCKKRITVALVDGVWRMPLWRFSTPSDDAIRHRNGQRTPTTTYDRRRRQTSFLAHRVLAPAKGFQFGGALTSSLSQFGGALTEPAIRGDYGCSAAPAGDRF